MASILCRPQCANVNVVISACTVPADIIFILDASGSIGEQQFETMKNFVYELVADLEIDTGGVRVGLEIFSNNYLEIYQVQCGSVLTRPGGRLNIKMSSY